MIANVKEVNNKIIIIIIIIIITIIIIIISKTTKEIKLLRALPEVLLNFSVRPWLL